MNNIIVPIVLSLLLSGCISCSIKPVLFTPQQVIDSVEPKEAEAIGALELKLRRARQALALLMQTGQIDEATANIVSAQTRAVDYYICKAWVAMVEGDVRLRDEATLFAQAGYDAVVKTLTKAIDAIEKTGI